MYNTQDLNIEKEILPLFDNTLNIFSKKIVLDILKTPLSSKEEILSRQSVFNGFTKNKTILKNYSYTNSYLLEVYSFLKDSRIEDFSEEKFKFKFLISKREKADYYSKFTQLILLFYRLESLYFSKLDTNTFPELFSKNISEIAVFLSSLNLISLNNVINNSKLNDNHIIKLTHQISKLKKERKIFIFWENLFLFEAYLSINIGINYHYFTFPKILEKGIKLDNFYHPLLDNPVTNNFESTKNVILLNGSNMSGKSTFLKAVSLCIYLGHLGLAIPASSGEIPFFSNFSIAINRRDDILNGYSHFMTEVMNLKDVVTLASRNETCFAVFDELFSGTNVEDAFEICKTTINGLCKFTDSIFFISTHIQELKELTNNDIATYFIECELIANKPTFTYKLKKGWSEVKVGRILFEKEGLNKLLK
jgi:DNA mismatch repair protein MutS